MDIRFNLIKPVKRRTHAKNRKTIFTEQRAEHLHSPKQEKGWQYEQEALDYLLAKGLILLEQNLACKMGEIDLVMQDQQTLVFVEVRFRRNTHYGGAIASITAHKYHKLQRTAYYFLPYLTHKFFQGKLPHCRFDALCIHGDSTEKIWLKNITLK